MSMAKRGEGPVHLDVCARAPRDCSHLLQVAAGAAGNLSLAKDHLLSRTSAQRADDAGKDLAQTDGGWGEEHSNRGVGLTYKQQQQLVVYAVAPSNHAAGDACPDAIDPLAQDKHVEDAVLPPSPPFAPWPPSLPLGSPGPC